jgi:hypothetical protein
MELPKEVRSISFRRGIILDDGCGHTRRQPRAR